MRRRGVLLAALGATTAAGTPARSPVPAPSTEAIRAMLASRIDPGGDSLGYVAGLAAADGARVITVGRADRADARALDGDSVFEIGSITKVFTALVLADMVQRGEVALADPVAKYLPQEAQPQTFDGRPMTLLDLVTYTSGLPRLPSDFQPKDPANPYADYTLPQLYAAAAWTPPHYYPGSHYEYTNFGFALLGQALALRAGTSYEALVVARICAPLGLDDTRVTLTPAMRQRLVPGHDASLRRVPNWDLPAFAGAGALCSTANDLLRFVAACQGRSALAAAFASLLEQRRQTDTPEQYVAEGWFVRMQHDDELVWKDGATGGYSSFIGYSPRSGNAAVLLANAQAGYVTPLIGWHLVNPASPVPPLHRQVVLDPAALTALAGRYPITPDFALTVTPRDGRLMVQATNQDEFEVFAESPTRFFYRVIDAQLTFELGPDGTATTLALRQNGRTRRAARSPRG